MEDELGDLRCQLDAQQREVECLSALTAGSICKFLDCGLPDQIHGNMNVDIVTCDLCPVATEEAAALR